MSNIRRNPSSSSSSPLAAAEYLRTAAELTRDGDGMSALSVLEAGRLEHPQNQQLHIEHVVHLRKLGMEKEALKATNLWLHSHDDAGARMLKLKILRELNLAKEASHVATAILRTTPDNPIALATLGWAMLICGKQTEGRRLLDEALAAHPDDENILFECMLSRQASGDIVGAISLLESAIVRDTNNPLLHVYLGRALRAAGRLQEATEHAKAAEELEGRTFRVRYLLGRIAVDSKDSDEALAIGQNLVKCYPNEAGSFKVMAGSLFERGQYIDALSNIRTAMHLRPNDREAEYLFRQVISQMPKRDLYVQAWRIAKEGIGLKLGITRLLPPRTP